MFLTCVKKNSVIFDCLTFPLLILIRLVSLYFLLTHSTIIHPFFIDVIMPLLIDTTS